MLVTHDMATVQGLCDRAMLIHDGEQRYIGDPEETAMRYYRLNFERAAGAQWRRRRGAGRQRERRRRVDRERRPASGCATSSRVSRSACGAVFEARQDLEAPIFGFHFLTEDGATLFGFNRP